MDIPQLIALLSRWLHIIPAMILVGGTLFLRFSLVPAAIETNPSSELREAVRKRWARMVMLSILLLLLSGLYNAAQKAINYELSMVYNVMLLLKIILGLAVFYLLSVLSGRSDRAKRLREREPYWLNITSALMIVLVCIAGWMKLSEQPKKDKSAASATVKLTDNLSRWSLREKTEIQETHERSTDNRC